tara:strand:+ start:2557 stop:3633 length:1077 start_codon:yes stop_codon:yes gene_type:complete
MSVTRQEAVVGQAIKLSLILNADGAALDIDEVVRVELFDASDMSIIRSFTGVDIIKEDVGNYYVITDAFDNAITLIDRWTYLEAVGLEAEVVQFSTAVLSPSVDDRLSGMAIGIDYIKTNYLFGLDLSDDEGNPFPDQMFVAAIRYASAFIEKKLDILLTPRTITETHDYILEEYRQFGWFQLDKRPLNQVDSVSAVYPFSSDGDNTTIIDFPKSMISVPIRESGQVQLIPNQGTMAQFMLGRGASYLPLIRNGYAGNYPALFKIVYNAGFKEVPDDIKHCVSLYACLNILDVAGDLIVGAGIASKSISIGGLSQSINTTSSATNAGYGARILSYQKQIKVLLPTLERYYHGLRMTVV